MLRLVILGETRACKLEVLDDKRGGWRRGHRSGVHMAGRCREGEQGGEGKQRSRPTGGPGIHTKNLDPRGGRPNYFGKME